MSRYMTACGGSWLGRACPTQAANDATLSNESGTYVEGAVLAPRWCTAAHPPAEALGLHRASRQSVNSGCGRFRPLPCQGSADSFWVCVTVGLSRMGSH